MPQLNTATFPSQVFWVVLGFCCVYAFMFCVVVPKIRRIVDSRKNRIDGLLETARSFDEETEGLRNAIQESLDSVRKEIFEMEESLTTEFNRKKDEEEKRISGEVTARAQREIDSLHNSAKEAFAEISADLDELVDLASMKISEK